MVVLMDWIGEIDRLTVPVPALQLVHRLVMIALLMGIHCLQTFFELQDLVPHLRNLPQSRITPID